eukprot:2925137-Karenia_brevis.AAC.1
MDKWDLTSVQPPGRHELRKTILKLRGVPSCTGGDGIPYSAWGACPDESADTLDAAMSWTFEGGELDRSEHE